MIGGGKMQSKTNKQGVHFDPAIIGEVIRLAKILRKCSDVNCSKIPSTNGTIRASDIPVHPADTKDEDVLAYRAAKNDVMTYLSGLPLQTVKDILALMYLGRNGKYDGLHRVPVKKRLALYDDSRNFKDKNDMIRQMVEKCRLLDEYLEDGLCLLT
jgi:hypothetical protein